MAAAHWYPRKPGLAVEVLRGLLREDPRGHAAGHRLVDPPTAHLRRQPFRWLLPHRRSWSRAVRHNRHSRRRWTAQARVIQPSRRTGTPGSVPSRDTVVDSSQGLQAIGWLVGRNIAPAWS